MAAPAKNEILELGLTLIAEGISVIPLLPRSKKPALKSWAEYQEHIADEATVRTWFEKPGKNIGIVCGKVSGNLAGLDFDVPERAAGWFKQREPLLVGCPVVSTGREKSGCHIYLRTTAPLPCSKNGIFEVKGEGGYLVGPGSTHPSGRPYELLDGSDMSKIPTLDPALLGLEAPPAVNGNGQGKPRGWEIPLLQDVPIGERNKRLVLQRFLPYRLSVDRVLM